MQKGTLHMRSISHPWRLALGVIATVLLTVGLTACDPNDPGHVQAFFDLNPEAGAEVTVETFNAPQRAVVQALQDRQTQFYMGVIAAQSVESHRRAIQLDPFLTCVRRHESDRGGYPHINGYGAQNPYGSASGAYQFIDGTWRNASRVAGHGGYARASHAPWWVQDAVAHHLAYNGGRSAWAGTGCPGT